MKVVFGSQERMFLNTSLGCALNCSYCYLKALGCGDVQLYHSDEILSSLNSLDCFNKGPGGTILSIGCYSECLAADTIDQTFELISRCLEYGNYVQLSTKKKLPRDMIELLEKRLLFPNQLVINTSIPTVTQSHLLEQGTDSPDERMENFELLQGTKVGSVLYIKPVIDDITILDILHYAKILKKYEIKCVVGSFFSTKTSLKPTEVGEGMLFEQSSHQCEEIRLRLSEITKVYEHSTDIINDYRMQNKRT